MPKHLYTIPPVEALPDPAGLPEGSPVLFGGTLYTLQDGVFVATGGSAVESGTTQLYASAGTHIVTASPGTWVGIVDTVEANAFARGDAGVTVAVVNNGTADESRLSFAESGLYYFHLELYTTLAANQHGDLGVMLEQWDSGLVARSEFQQELRETITDNGIEYGTFGFGPRHVDADDIVRFMMFWKAIVGGDVTISWVNMHVHRVG